MGLLDSVIGALGQGQPQAGAAGGGGQGDVLGMILALLAQQGGAGGLGGLVEKFQHGGLGDVIGSWVGTGQNLPISPDQLGGVLGHDTVAGLARQLGIEPGAALGQLSQVLPQVVDRMTPQGQLPAAGDGAGMGDLGSLLNGLGSR